MRVYRVHLYSGVEGSQGYRWFSSKADADAACRVFLNNWSDKEPVAIPEPVTFLPSKKDILRLLNEYAAHEDNG